MKKKKDKSRLLTVSVVSFLLLVFVVGFIYGLSSVLAMEGARCQCRFAHRNTRHKRSVYGLP